ncbi:MAG: 3D domain-containing protein [Armatimonadota bacterium]
MEATAYYWGPECIGPGATGRAASGVKAGYGIVAVDRDFIPLGTRLYVEGYGYAVAADVGSAIKGNRIDLCFDDYALARAFGRRTVEVYVLE